MLNKVSKYKFEILALICIVFCFAVIRIFQRKLFYDPFLEYFDHDFKNLPFPQVDLFKLFCGLFFRYFLNTILSLILIFALFKDKQIFKFSAFLYIFFFALLFALFFIILEYFPDANWLLFYVRRFIIQPIFILLFIPAFYYQQESLKK
jgi:exosortase F-associated protein